VASEACQEHVLGGSVFPGRIISFFHVEEHAEDMFLGKEGISNVSFEADKMIIRATIFAEA
jgi:hypothetical protein